jgi:hypothetical protein
MVGVKVGVEVNVVVGMPVLVIDAVQVGISVGRGRFVKVWATASVS